MRTLLFEVMPRDGHEDYYFQHAAKLKPLVMQESGLLFLDRFRSLSRDKLILSHSRWRDEAAIASWRSECTHYKSQEAGRNKHFADYRLRIAKPVIALTETGDITRDADENDYWDQKTKPPRYHAIIVSQNAGFDGTGETFESVYNDGVFLHIQDCANYEDGDAVLAEAKNSKNVQYGYLCLTSRDYGMFEREEAPQYFPEVVF